METNISVDLGDRKVEVESYDGGYYVAFTRPARPHELHSGVGVINTIVLTSQGKHVTEICLTAEAAYALMACLQDMLKFEEDEVALAT